MEALICVCPEDSGKRLDVFLSERLDISRARTQTVIAEGGALVNGIMQKPSFRLKTGELVSFEFEDPIEAEARPEAMELDILYEDAELIFVNKPRGMVVHPAAGHSGQTLVNGLLYHCGQSLSGINGVMRPGIVHRIDRETYGILVSAKTDRAHISLSGQFAEHSVTRVYCALCRGVPKQDAFTIDKPLGRHPGDRKKFAVVPEGKKAVTHINVTERFRKSALVEARLETGRTHQIRVHMAHAGHPLIGDELYGTAVKGLSGQMLHAGILGFIHPISGEYMEFKRDAPDAFLSELERQRGM
jgi:23S rRNA pseudouridine1911/1915/1917 synthase